MNLLHPSFIKRLPLVILLFGVSLALAQPSVDLGNDTVVCGPVILDAGNPGASYLWSTSETTQTITVSATDTVWVTVTDGSGSGSDTVRVFIANSPPAFVASDTVFCGEGQVIEYRPPGVSGMQVYSLGGDSIISINDEDSIVVDISTADSLEFSYLNFVDFRTGLPDTIPGISNKLGILGRGLTFDVLDYLWLDSLKVYITSGTNLRVQILDPSGSLFSDQTFPISSGGFKTIAPELLLPPGLGYKILVANISGGHDLYRVKPAVFPIVVGDVIHITGSQNGGNDYNYFFDWHVRAVGCAGAPGIMAVAIEATPFPTLSEDTSVCGSLVLLDAGYAGTDVTYEWSTGDSTNSVMVDSSGWYYVTNTLEDCSVEDSILVTLVEEPDVATVADTSFCLPGTYELTAIGNGNAWQWTDPTAQIVQITESNQLSANVANSGLWQVQGLGLGRGVKEGRSLDVALSSPHGNRGTPGGLTFSVEVPIYLKSVDVYLESSTPGMRVAIENAEGERLFFINTPLPQGGRNTIPIDIYLPADSGYRILLEGVGGGVGLLWENGFTDFPISKEGHLKVTGTHLGIPNRYWYFYDFEVEPALCFSTVGTIDVTLEIPVQLDSSIYSCRDTLLQAIPLGADTTGMTFNWGGMGNTRSFRIDTSGFYPISIVKGGCTYEDTIEVNIPRRAGLPVGDPLCGNILSTNYGEDAVFQWSTGDTTPTITITQPGEYWVQVLEPRGCLLPDTVLVTSFSDIPVFSLGADTTGCAELVLEPQSGFPGYNYLWSTGDTTSAIRATSSGEFDLTITSTDNCYYSDTISVFVVPEPVAQFDLPDTVYNQGLVVSFVNQSTFGGSRWSFGDGATSTLSNPIHTYPAPGAYCVELIQTDILNNCGSDTTTDCFVLLETNTGLSDAHLAIPPLMLIDFGSNSPSIQFTTDLHNVRIQIFDFGGRQLWENDYPRITQNQLWTPSEEVAFARGALLVRVVSASGAWQVIVPAGR